MGKISAYGGGGNAEMPWVIQMRTIILDYFGPESNEYDYSKKFIFKDEKSTPENYGHNIHLAQEFLMRCMETIKDKGIYRPKKKNFLNDMDQKALVAWIALLAAAIFFLGKFEEKFEHQDDHQNIKNLSDSLHQSQGTNQLLNDSIIKLKSDATKNPDTLPHAKHP